MIDVAKNFLSSVNISYDIGNKEKIKSFIPTQDFLQLLEDILLSTKEDSTKRARILIGAYGKGKSYMILEILSLLNSCKDDLDLYTDLILKVKEYNTELAKKVKEYILSNKRLLPIIINGGSTNLFQSFLYALRSTLKQKDFSQLLPETCFESAITTIDLWKDEYPQTYKAFIQELSLPIDDFIYELQNYNQFIYKEFIDLYPKLTSGSNFNPYVNNDVVALYSEVCEKLQNFGYNGIYLIYDEFGKYLESNITHATINDVKLLQDFAEKANRSGKNQLHIMLICHKEIQNYIDVLPKQKVDGWKGVSERFLHIHLNNSFSETYELIQHAILKKTNIWEQFKDDYSSQFNELIENNENLRVFEDLTNQQIKSIIYGGYPLHPITTYILPRLSEKVAQNERTLFTFLSSPEKNTLSSILRSQIINDDYAKNEKIFLISPDVLYDYFSIQMQNESYNSDIKKYHLLSQNLLLSVNEKSLESKIIKTLTLFYILNQFERLPPSIEMICSIFSKCGYEYLQVTNVIKNLCKKLNILYERISSNGYLQLKENSGFDVQKLINEKIERRKNQITNVQIINNFNCEKYLYPVEYNNKFKITRYYEFYFVDYDLEQINEIINQSESDGLSLAVLDVNDESDIIEISKKNKNVLFIKLKTVNDISKYIRKYDAVYELIKDYSEDKLLINELAIIQQDLYEVLMDFIYSFLQPEKRKADYYLNGIKQEKLFRKANLTKLLSLEMEKVFSKTPIINNEMLNKNNLSGQAQNSRIKLINGILNSSKANLDLIGSAQEVSFMRSALIVPGILSENGDEEKRFNFTPEKDGENFTNLFREINLFLEECKKSSQSFYELFQKLTLSQNKIGLRCGLIPIYFAVAISDIQKNVVIKNANFEIPFNAQNICLMADEPQNYFVSILEWSSEKDFYVQKVESLFLDFVIEAEKNQNGYLYLLNAINRWYRNLPKYTKQIKNKFLEAIRESGTQAQDFLFVKLPNIFDAPKIDENLFTQVESTKKYFDFAKMNLENELCKVAKKIITKWTEQKNENISLCNICKSFLSELNLEVKNHIFENGAQKIITIFENAQNDELALVENLAPILTGLNIDDWSDDIILIFVNRLDEFIKTLHDFSKENSQGGKKELHQQGKNKILTQEDEDFVGEVYSISFAKNSKKENFAGGKKTFNKVECSKRAAILQNEIQRTMEEMGQSISEAEKRQVLINLIEKLC